ncbi:MAG: J domain-containing protein [Cytophagaceae bacterium]|nr:J domain-containing protein [Cytophagaceae bacterium]
MTTESIETYYKILGVIPNATVEEIKRAYRKKAKDLHPDKNKSQDAHEKFILLTEAYECLTNIKSGKARVQQKTKSYSDWQKENRDTARNQARKYAEMQYEEFKKTDYYKNSQAAFIVGVHLYFFSAIIIMLSPLWGYIYKEWTGFWVGLLISFMLVHFWAGIFSEIPPLNLRSFFKSILIVIKTKAFLYAIITVINLIVLFRITFNTQFIVLPFL